MLHGKPRARYPKQRHSVHGLLSCARCGCAITAEKKKGKYIYYRLWATKAHAATATSARNSFAELPGDVIKPVQITTDIAEDIATGLRGIDHRGGGAPTWNRCDNWTNADERSSAKLDRGYDDLVSGRISEESGHRKSQEWETELATIDATGLALEQPRPLATVNRRGRS